MLKMRLQRVGRKNDPSYRVVVTDSRTSPKSNKHIDLLGAYSAKQSAFSVDGERVEEWISKGVQVSPTVHNLLISNKIIEGKKINVLPRKTPVINEAKLKAEAEAKAAAEAAEKAAAEAAVETPVEVTEEVAPEVIEETPAEEEKAA